MEKAIKPDRYQVFICASPANLPFFFAKHTWVVINKKGIVSRFEVYHSSQIRPFEQRESQGHWDHLYKNYLPPFQGIPIFPFWWKFLWKGKILFQIEGTEESVAHRMCTSIEHSPETYPFKEQYSLLGPNSNTYTQWILNQFPEITIRLPATAFGKNWIPRF